MQLAVQSHVESIKSICSFLVAQEVVQEAAARVAVTTWVYHNMGYPQIMTW